MVLRNLIVVARGDGRGGDLWNTRRAKLDEYTSSGFTGFGELRVQPRKQLAFRTRVLIF